MEEKKALPDGIEWPRYTDGRLVRIGGCWQQDGFDESVTCVDSISFAEDGVRLENEYNEAFYRYGERVKRPAPKALDADGVEIRKGDTVWTLKDARELEVIGLYPEQGSRPVKVKEHRNGVYIFSGVEPSGLTHRAPVLAADGRPLEAGQTVYHIADGREYRVRELLRDGGAMVDAQEGLTGRCRADYLTHQRPVPDADGEPLREGETVRSADSGTRYTVEGITDGLVPVKCRSEMGSTVSLHPSQLTRTKPEPADTYAKLYEDVHDERCGSEEFVRRCRALAERGE